ncbi:unnamed protein product [Pieris brassicae]|uniref:Uncharacterized protein n=1 Tax=Pieris brassicae TaxID=7116 RepID=A0A9P0T2V2_PIEBR|nr:unnamed protein product [Pieris brassicae]
MYNPKEEGVDLAQEDEASGLRCDRSGDGGTLRVRIGRNGTDALQPGERVCFKRNTLALPTMSKFNENSPVINIVQLQNKAWNKRIPRTMGSYPNPLKMK